MEKKIAHGFRIIECPKCGYKLRGTWLEKIVSCGRKGCGYFDPEEYFKTPLGLLKKIVKQNENTLRKIRNKQVSGEQGETSKETGEQTSPIK